MAGVVTNESPCSDGIRKLAELRGKYINEKGGTLKSNLYEAIEEWPLSAFLLSLWNGGPFDGSNVQHA